MAPIHITFMLAVALGVDPASIVGAETWYSSAGEEVRQWMKDNNLCTATYGPTDRLRAFITHLCDQPLPEKKWVMPA